MWKLFERKTNYMIAAIFTGTTWISLGLTLFTGVAIAACTPSPPQLGSLENPPANDQSNRISQQPSQPAEKSSEKPSEQLPAPIADAVKRNLAKRSGIPVTALKIHTAKRQTWTDGCLGLARANELCTQVVIEGWQVTLTDGKKTWTYRTNNNGQFFRLEPKTKK